MSLIQGTIEKIVFGGEGLVRKERFVYFAPYVIPGEEVLLAPVIKKRSFARCHTSCILAPSPHRTLPLCRHFGSCGGCQFQHMAYQEQVLVKQTIITDALRFVYNSTIPITPAQQTLFWRRKIALHAQRTEGCVSVGYYQQLSSNIVAIQECPLFFTPQEGPILDWLRMLAEEALPCNGSSCTIHLQRLPSSQFALALKGSPLPEHQRQQRLKHLLERSDACPFFSITCGKWHYSNYEEPLFIPYEALHQSWVFSPSTFMQNHPHESQTLWETIVRRAMEDPATTVFDLYSGIGITASLLAQQGKHVFAVEANAQAVQCAQEHAQRKAYFHCLQGSVETVVPTIPEQAQLWILNPPRTGLSPEVISLITKKRPHTVLYISCSPPTLARDLREITTAGWSLDHVQSFDLFPQTTHLETIALLHSKNA